MKNKIVYITAQSPFGKGESFILEEMDALIQNGVELLIFPRSPSKDLFHRKSQELSKYALYLPIINLKIFNKLVYELFRNVNIVKVLLHVIANSRNIRTIIKNCIVFPKSIYLTNILKEEKATHIHAHWGSTTSTMAYVISQITGIPWSFTLHRWDIKENNMLKEKIKSAKFARCISEHGKNELIEIIGKEHKNIKVIHVGVKVPADIKESAEDKKPFTILAPANLLEVKGHKYLIEACSILVKQGIGNFRCIFYGEGQLRSELENLINKKGLAGYIKMPGIIPHEKLTEMYKEKEADIVILPSIITDKGEHEGIPVSLMEAMAHGIPVISTNTGGITELIEDGSGIIIEQKNPEAIAKAIGELMNNSELYKKISILGREKILKDFNEQVISGKIISLFNSENISS